MIPCSPFFLLTPFLHASEISTASPPQLQGGYRHLQVIRRAIQRDCGGRFNAVGPFYRRVIQRG